MHIEVEECNAKFGTFNTDVVFFTFHSKMLSCHLSVFVVVFVSADSKFIISDWFKYRTNQPYSVGVGRVQKNSHLFALCTINIFFCVWIAYTVIAVCDSLYAQCFQEKNLF